MFYDVTHVQPLAEYRLHLRFEDGSEGQIDLRSQIQFTGVFEPLREETEFRKVRVNPELGTIQWPNEADLDPVVLYSAVTGRSIADVLGATTVR